MKYFVKYVASNSIYVNGTPVPFELLQDDVGVIALDESSQDPRVQAILKSLTAAAANRILGVGEITKEQYEDLKKKLPLVRSAVFLTPYPRLDNLLDPQQRKPQPPVQPDSQAPSGEPAAAGPAEDGVMSGRAEAGAEDPKKAFEAILQPQGFTPATRRVRQRQTDE